MSYIQPFPSVARELLASIQDDPYWDLRLRDLADGDQPHAAAHLAIFVEPYLRYILEGRKTIESRFSVHRTAPYHVVQRGDVLLLKRSGGPIVGLCEVSDVWFYELDADSWRIIRQEFTQALCAQDPAFWRERESACFATLMRVHHVRATLPIGFAKQDRRGWVVLRSAHRQLELSGLGEDSANFKPSTG